MSATTSSTARLAQHETARRETDRADALLAAGALAGPVFLIASFAQLPLNPGFDMTRNAFSFLTLGPFGWLQQGVFVLVGLLNVAAAAGLARTLPGRAGRATALLTLLLGVGQVVSGSFRPDPAFGYPAGAPAGVPEQISAISTVHGIAFAVSVTAWVALLVVLGVRLRRNRLVAVGAPLLALALLVVPAVGSLPLGTVYLYVAVSIGFLVTSAIFAGLATGRIRS